MAIPLEFLHSLQIFVAILLAASMAIAMIFWFIKMWNVGAIAGNYFTLFFACIMMFAIFYALTTLTSSSDITKATFCGSLAYALGFLGWFGLFLAGEYSLTDSPPPMRVMIVGTCHGISLGGYIYTLLTPPGSGLLYVSYVKGFGWVIHVTPFFLIVLITTCLFSLAYFFQFCYKAFRSAPDTRLGNGIKRLIIALSFGLAFDVVVLGAGWWFTDLSILSPIIAMGGSSVFQIIAFIFVFREYRIIYFMPHKAIGIIVLTTEGVVCFDHSFQKERGSNAIHNLLGPALTAVNNLVQETLELTAIEWIREFRTEKMTFLLDVRVQYDLIGLLVVSRATRILRRSFRTFMNNLMTFYEKSGGELCDTPQKEKKLHEICAKAFLYIPPVD